MSKLTNEFFKAARKNHQYGSRPKPPQTKVVSSEVAYQMLCSFWGNIQKERYTVLLLDQNNRCVGIKDLSGSPVAGTAKEAFAAAIESKASSMILSRYTPTGQLRFSPEDHNLTDKFVMAGILLCIDVVDHIVVTRAGYRSLADRGLMPGG